MSKKKKDEWVDDGRIIANMDSVMDINSATLGRPRRAKRPFDPFGQVAPKKEPIELTRQERRKIVHGIVMAHGVVLLILLILTVILIYAMPT